MADAVARARKRLMRAVKVGATGVGAEEEEEEEFVHEQGDEEDFSHCTDSAYFH